MSEDLQAINLRIAVLTVQAKDLATEAKEARADAERAYMPARRAGVKSQTPILPGGIEAGTIAIKAGMIEVDVREEELTKFVAGTDPGQIETYLLPGAASDPRVLELIGAKFPELVGQRVKAAHRTELVNELAETGGTLVSPATGEKVTLATIVRLQATGEFAYTPGKKGTEAIRAALAAGTITPDGRFADGVPAVATGQTEPDTATEPGPDDNSGQGDKPARRGLRLLGGRKDGAA